MYIMDETFDYQVLNLTAKFYNDYPDPPFTEIIRKNTRPYNCLLMQSSYGYFICIPYRSNVKHKYSYKFKYSERSKRTHSGLDYTKIVIVRNPDYIGNSDAVIDADEYRETRDNIDFIKKDAQSYIDNYVQSIRYNSREYNSKNFQRIYGFSTLKYFHKELEIIPKR